MDKEKADGLKEIPRTKEELLRKDDIKIELTQLYINNLERLLELPEASRTEDADLRLWKLNEGLFIDPTDEAIKKALERVKEVQAAPATRKALKDVDPAEYQYLPPNTPLQTDQ